MNTTPFPVLFTICLPTSEGALMKISLWVGEHGANPGQGAPFWLGSSSERKVRGAQRGCQRHQIQRFGTGLFSPHQIPSTLLIIPRKVANDDCRERE